ncbi:MAG: ABC transporter ATP-binding protein [Myxococcales bacterium]|nr:ABC transporter ATP-binding protein [Myxococcales bacterium]
MIDLVDLGKSYGGRTLFAGVNVRLNAGSRYGLVGANGSGKTTLMQILAGKETATDGRVVIPTSARVGTLEQDRFLSDDLVIVEVAMMGDELVWGAMREQEALFARAAESDVTTRLAELDERMHAHDGYTLESRAAAVLEGLGIPARQHRLPLSTLSGGFKLRVLLAQTLVGKPDLLLLDEPTNHLDILTIRWLERFLESYEGCAVVISHDHRFLDTVSNAILDVDYDTVTVYTGNYSRFIVEKRQTSERMEAAATRQQEIIDEKKAFIERFRAKASKARQAQSRAKQVEKLEEKLSDPPKTSRRAPKFRFLQRRKSGAEVLVAEDLGKSYGEKCVLTGVSLTVRRGERVAIIGANGLGKSTLLKILVGRLAADRGTASWGYEAHAGYFAQDHGEHFDDASVKVLDFLWNTCPGEPTTYVRGQLGTMLFSGEDVDKKVGALSGGEAARLIMCRLIVQKPNVLVLDEPTNHLDLESIESLVVGLKAFEGTLLFVSHDRHFVAELATRVIELRPDGLFDYAGTYAEYLAHSGADHLDAAAVKLRAKAGATDRPGPLPTKAGASHRPAPPPTKEGFSDRKKRRSEATKLVTVRDRAASAIDRIENRLREITADYCRPGFFEKTAPAEVLSLQAEESALGPELERLMGEWERLEGELADTDGTGT